VHGGAAVTGAVAYNADTRVAIFTPGTILTGSTVYDVAISTGAKDLAGNAVASEVSWSFTTIDTSIPYVISHVPAADAVDVAAKSVITATFSEAMNETSLTTPGTFFVIKNPWYTSGPVPARPIPSTVEGSVTYNSETRTATFTPAADMSGYTDYAVTITTAAKDVAGNAMTKEVSWNYKTIDTYPPYVSSHVPDTDATDVLLDSVITAIFDETMEAASITASDAIVVMRNAPLPGGPAQGDTETGIDGTVTYDNSTRTTTFTPTSNLTAGYNYSVTITGAKDKTGNAMTVPETWSFSTTADNVNPTVNGTTPAASATGVALDAAFTVDFSEALRASTIVSPATTLTVVTESGGTTVEGTVTYSDVGTHTATFTPTAPLTANTRYNFRINEGVKDLAGNPLSIIGNSWDFATGPLPEVTSTTPDDGAFGVAEGVTQIKAYFSETMEASSITGSTFFVRMNAPIPGGPVPGKYSSVSGTVTYEAVTRTAVFTPDSPFLYPDAPYSATITTAAEDPAGNPLAKDYTWYFTTGPSPYVTVKVPADNSTEVAVNSTVQAVFNEEIDETAIKAAGAFTVKAGDAAADGTVSFDSGTHTATFTPTNKLAANTTYTAKVTTAKDLAGNPLTSEVSWSFTTDSIAPTVISTVPVNNSTEVAVSSTIKAIFSEAMDTDSITTSGTFVVMITGPASGGPVPGTTPYPIPVDGTVTCDSATRTATFTPAASLSKGKVYAAKINTTAKDLAGYNLAGSVTWSFTVGDTVKPTVTSSSPENNAYVPLATWPTATFSEAMDPDTITSDTFVVKDYSDTPLPCTVTYNAETRTATLKPTAGLKHYWTYTATVTTSARDLAGNGLASDFVWHFVGNDTIPPTVSVTDPVNSSTEVAVSSTIKAIFSEAMDADTITNTGTFVVMMTGPAAGGPVPGVIPYPVQVDGTVTYDADTRTATFTPAASLTGRKVYGVTISTAAKDLAGNSLTGEVSWNFTTDTIAPAVISTAPGNNSTEIAISSTIKAIFSEAMDTSSVTASGTFTLTLDHVLPGGPVPGGGGTVSGTVTYDFATRTATFTPSANLTANSVYVARVTTAAKDLAAIPLASESTWTFTTQTDVTPPTVSFTYSGYGGRNPLTATFSEAMDESTINETTFTVDEFSTPVDGVVTYDAVNKKAYFTPSSDWGYGCHFATITTDVKDLAGNSIEAVSPYHFHPAGI
ncbi:MAG: Ig-like domain-containing protein, partial [Candidatus Wallbacteria bacterium]|nr:Ig-like domain-containing protein [Candidatus Wallbacteria bacterium]